MKYSRSITFPPLYFMLYRGKSISFGTEYSENGEERRDYWPKRGNRTKFVGMKLYNVPKTI